MIFHQVQYVLTSSLELIIMACVVLNLAECAIFGFQTITGKYALDLVKL